MRATIDAAGRVVIPKPLRVRLGLEPGTAVEVRERDGRIEIEVAAPAEDRPPLTDDLVRAMIERTRR